MTLELKNPFLKEIKTVFEETQNSLGQRNRTERARMQYMMVQTLICRHRSSFQVPTWQILKNK